MKWKAFFIIFKGLSKINNTIFFGSLESDFNSNEFWKYILHFNMSCKIMYIYIYIYIYIGTRSLPSELSFESNINTAKWSVDTAGNASMRVAILS